MNPNFSFSVILIFKDQWRQSGQGSLFKEDIEGLKSRQNCTIVFKNHLQNWRNMQILRPHTSPDFDADSPEN